MLKNIWEIENHPIFSSGGSFKEEAQDVNEGAIR